MKKHLDFILTPISSLFEEAVIATKGIGEGIETYPLSGYIIESLFLRTTGFQEQKLKCIHWQLAVNSYEYRRKNFFQKIVTMSFLLIKIRINCLKNCLSKLKS